MCGCLFRAVSAVNMLVFGEFCVSRVSFVWCCVSVLDS